MKEYQFRINGKAYRVQVGESQGKILPVSVNGAPYEVEWTAAADREDMAAEVVSSGAAPGPASVPVATAQAAQGPVVKVEPPMQGVLIEIAVKEGQAVKAGQKVAVLEAMKMENEITAPKDGTVTAILAHKGDTVGEGDTILTIS